MMTNNQQIWDISRGTTDVGMIRNAVEEIVGDLMPVVATTRIGTALGATVSGRALMSAMPVIVALGVAAMTELASGTSEDP